MIFTLVIFIILMSLYVLNIRVFKQHEKDINPIKTLIMKKFFLSIFYFAFGLIVFAQNYQLSFKSSDINTTIDSVIVRNLTNGLSTTLRGDDTLQLSSVVGIKTFEAELNNYVKVYPNPFINNCFMEFATKEHGGVSICVYDIYGRKHLETKLQLERGIHTFSLSGLGFGQYLVKVSSNSDVVKSSFVSLAEPEKIAELKYVSSSFSDDRIKTKSFSNIKTMHYNNGDVILLIGKSGVRSTYKVVDPISITSAIFEFVDCTDIDGNNYSAVTIDTQVWMVENLRTTRYRNGEEIGTTEKDISQDKDGSYQWAYAHNESLANIYGRLYTWYAATDVRNVAPEGWHVPSDEEWTTLITYLGGQLYAGGKLKEVGFSHWPSPNATASNTSGFTAIPGGYRGTGGVFLELNVNAYWWSSTQSDVQKAWERDILSAYGNYVGRSSYGKKIGFYVRCIKD